MWFLGLGLLGVALKFLEIGPVAQWSWLVVLIPFGLAIVWWAWADWSGYTKRKAVDAVLPAPCRPRPMPSCWLLPRRPSRR